MLDQIYVKSHHQIYFKDEEVRKKARHIYISALETFAEPKTRISPEERHEVCVLGPLAKLRAVLGQSEGDLALLNRTGRNLLVHLRKHKKKGGEKGRK